MLKLGIIASEAATASAGYERIFGLDIQLGHDVLWTALAIFILFFALSYLLFNPAREMLEKRKKKISDELHEANERLSNANEMKSEYEAKLQNVDSEVAEIMDNARRKALKAENEIINEAKEEANVLRRRALADIELEKAHARDEVKKEIVVLASEMAKKVIDREMNDDIQDALIEETLNGIGDDTWQDQ